MTTPLSTTTNSDQTTINPWTPSTDVPTTVPEAPTELQTTQVYSTISPEVSTTVDITTSQQQTSAHAASGQSPEPNTSPLIPSATPARDSTTQDYGVSTWEPMTDEPTRKETSTSAETQTELISTERTPHGGQTASIPDNRYQQGSDLWTSVSSTTQPTTFRSPTTDDDQLTQHSRSTIQQGYLTISSTESQLSTETSTLDITTHQQSTVETVFDLSTASTDFKQSTKLTSAFPVQEGTPINSASTERTLSPVPVGSTTDWTIGHEEGGVSPSLITYGTTPNWVSKAPTNFDKMSECKTSHVTQSGCTCKQNEQSACSVCM